MISRKMLRTRLALALLAGAAPLHPLFAQAASDPATQLSDYLRQLAEDPRNAEALIGAGNAALAAGDARAAVTFFGRAEEVRSSDGRVKAGLGAAMVQLESPQQALTYLDQAVRMGVPEYQVARDRGLAYDLLGNPRRAQQDYRLALQHGDDDELRRRLALSLAISGDKQAALDAIDAQVRRQDRAGWRTRAFVLALTGDTAGAMEAANVMMPGQAGAMQPFFAGLAGLTAAQRALAVNFGEFPSAGSGSRIASGFQSSSPSLPLAADQTGSLAPGLNTAPPLASDVRRRPDVPTAATTAPPVSPRVRPVAPPVAAIQLPAKAIETSPPAASVAAPKPMLAGPPQQTLSLPPTTVAYTAPPAAPKPLPPAAIDPPPMNGISQIELAPSAPKLADAAPTPAVSRPAPKASSFLDIAASIDDLRDEPKRAARSARPAAPEKTIEMAANELARSNARSTAKTADKDVSDKKSADKDAADKKAKKSAGKKPPPKPVEPSRIWVQVAGGANDSALPKEYKRLQEKAPKLLGKRAAWTVPLKATNRLLVGPFKSDDDAQDFVNELRKSGLHGFSWTSDEGQKIAKLD